MSVLDKGTRPRVLTAGRVLISRPELLAGAVVLLAWCVLLLPARHALDSSLTGSQRSAMAAMPGMAMDTGSGTATSRWLPAATEILYWVLMTVAMMGPASLPGIRHTGLNSLRWRRGRAIAEFSACYLVVWTVVGVVELAAARLTTRYPSWVGLAVVLSAAAVWELSPAKRRASLACHRPAPLPLYGWSAERGALLFGLRQGASCVGTCWCLMLTMAVIPGGHLLWMAALTVVIAVERWAQRPRRMWRLTAGGLAVLAAGTIALAAVR